MQNTRHASIYAIKGLTARQLKRYNAGHGAMVRSFWGELSAMIDNFSILLSHALLLIAFWYLTKRDDLDSEEPPTPDTDPEGFVKKRVKPGQINRSDARQDKP